MNAFTLDHVTLSDAQLVERHLAGDRGAFPEIVARYQSMVCALALSACGDVGRSEDLAQEVFVTAWKKLSDLHEPEKLRGWLCGIARNLTQNSWRRIERTPTARAEELSPELAGGDLDPREQASGVDERALLWRLLDDIPLTYREPLVLYYREERSMGTVAATLEISEEAVRQRLARGRTLLNERMMTLLEESLKRTRPTAVFTSAVLQLVPLATGPMAVAGMAGAKGGGVAKALTGTLAVGGAVAKGGALVKTAAVVGVLPALLNSFTLYRQFQASYDAPQTESDRGTVARRYLGGLLSVATIFIGGAVLLTWGLRYARPHPVLYGCAWALTVLVPLIVLHLCVFARRDAGWMSKPRPARGFEYRSRRSFLGWPLVVIRTTTTGAPKGERVVRAWIAVGDVAIGRLFACGAVAIAPLSVGGVALGGIAFGGAGLGVMAIGGFAAGWMALGGGAVGWYAAMGGGALAHNFAEGGVALAIHANDAAAHDFFASHVFFVFGDYMARLSMWAGMLAWIPSLLLILWHLLRKRAAR